MTRRSDGSQTGRRVFACRVDAATPAVMDQLAYDLECYRVGTAGKLVGATGILMDRIARGELIICKADSCSQKPDA